MKRNAKVLVLMTSPLDKVVHALRVVESIKRRLPELKITWVVRGDYEPLVASFDFVDHTIVFHRSSAPGKLFKLIREIRGERFDFVFDMEGHARTGAMCLVARSERKVGLKSAREGATICYTEVITGACESREHLVEQLQEFGSVFGLEARVGESLVFRDQSGFAKEWSEAGEAGRRRICLFPGRFKNYRAWSGMVDLAKRLVSEYDHVSVFLMGMVSSRALGSLPSRVFDLQEKLNWPGICLCLKEADLAVANDNGPAQLAGALGCKNLTLYSYVSPLRRGSYPLDGMGNLALQAEEGDVRRIELDTVFEAVEKLLQL